ncbi:MAG: SusC/RagA family TonB-linked outer membrane protein, partial [Candidatus Nephrothrix sp. EaCA]
MKKTFSKEGVYKWMRRGLMWQVLSVFSMVSFAAVSYDAGQGILQKKISLQVDNMKIKNVLKIIEQNAATRFGYQPQLIDSNRTVTLMVEDTPVISVLNMLFDSSVKFEEIGGMVIFKPAVVAHADGILVSGKVTDETGAPLPGVNVSEKGTINGTITDAEGEFALNVEGDSSALVFSFIGYESKEVPVAGQTFFDVKLSQEVKKLEEVVVIGYGERTKVSLVGAVSAIASKQIVTTKNENIQNMLTGKVAGLRIVQNSSEPGSFDTSMDIRGLGAPLVIIDGVPRNNITRLNPSDIETISVLKDASAAVYGVRAANGVIVITTKKGKAGDMKLEYNGSYGLQFPSRLPKPVDVFDYMTLVNEQRAHSWPASQPPLYTEADFEAYRNGTKTASNWQDEIIRKSAPYTQHDLNISGGTEKSVYFISLGYLAQDAIFKSDDVKYNRYTIRSNLSTKVGRRLTFDLNLSGILDRKDQPYISPWYVFRSLWYQPPVQNIYANNNPAYFNNVPSGLNGVAHSRSDVNGSITNNNKWFQSTISLKYDIPYAEGLFVKGLFSYDYTANSNKNYMKSYNLYRHDAATNTYNPVPQQTPATIRREFAEFPTKLAQLSLNYSKLINNDHRVSGLLLYERNIRSADNFYAQRELSIALDQLLAGNTANQQGHMSSDNLYETKNVSLVGRADYSYKDK